jgi:hypothetical protein
MASVHKLLCLLYFMLKPLTLGFNPGKPRPLLPARCFQRRHQHIDWRHFENLEYLRQYVLVEL